jgi:hypothetical protein
MRRLQAVAIGAENPEVHESVVVSVTVDMVELDRNPTIGCAFRPAAELTLRCFEAGREQSLL